MARKNVNMLPVVLPVIAALGVIFFVQINRKSAAEPVAELATPTPAPADTEIQIPDSDLITNALMEKNNWNPDEIKVTVSEIDAPYAIGGAGGETPGAGGGLWYAVKTDGMWKIIWQGNGVVTCADLTEYPDFPTDMIPECYDPAAGKIIKR